MRQRSLTHGARGRKPDAGVCCARHAAGDTQTSRELGNFQTRRHSPGARQYHFKGEVLNSWGELKYFLKTETSAVGFGEADCVGVNLKTAAAAGSDI